MPLAAITTNVQRLDAKSWGIGIVRAIVSGGANAVVSTVVVPVVMTGVDLKHMVLIAASTFLAAGFIDLMKFLATHPVPDYIEPVA